MPDDESRPTGPQGGLSAETVRHSTPPVGRDSSTPCSSPAAFISSIRVDSDAEQTCLPRSSACLSLFPFPLPPSTCADSQTLLRPGIFQSGQVPRVLVSREVLS